VRLLATTSLISLLAWPAAALEVPAEGNCPPHALRPGGVERPLEDVIAPLVRPGDLIDFGDSARLQSFVPAEVWERRDIFFFEGMSLEVGPCYRRYPSPPWFGEATARARGVVTLDADGNLVGFLGQGLPFAAGELDGPDAALRWAWNHRYRYQGSGFRGDFRIRHVGQRGRRVERFEGSFFMVSLRGVPGVKPEGNHLFVSGGRFQKPEVARGLAWRQFRSTESDLALERADEVFVYLPDDRKTRRAPAGQIEGIFVPSYTRAQGVSNEAFHMPNAEIGMSTGISASEPLRKGFVGLVIRPNAWRWRLVGTADVIAPINAAGIGYPESPERSFGPSGLSFGNDRWDVRRAVVIEGEARRGDGRIKTLKLWVDALTLQPLYLVTRRSNGGIVEVGIFVGRYSGDDPLVTKWAGGSTDFGAILPVGQTFFVSGDEGWMRESYTLEFDPPDRESMRRYLSTRRLERRGR
jgi:hypothetical protein